MVCTSREYLTFFQSYAYLLAAVWAFATTTLAVKPVDVLGKDFVNSETKERFQIIGVELVSRMRVLVGLFS